MQAIFISAIAIAAFLVYAPFFAVGFARAKAGFDLHAPRALFDKLPDWGKRATWAHQNAWEAFTIFTAAALMAAVVGVNSEWVIWVVGAHLLARSLYPVFYILDQPVLRGMMFAIGSLSSFTLMGLSIAQAWSSRG
ncbi:MAG: MAPEG family protein [Synechococcales bacterium]|nr:MAPEG family protein [Synechococcales bacterium]